MPRLPYIKFADISYELWALSEYLKVIDPQLAHLSEQDRRRLEQSLREEGNEGDEIERDIALREHWERNERVLPRLFRGPFLISLWAAYESAVHQIAEHHRAQKGLSLRFEEVRGGNNLSRAQRYYGAVIVEPLDLQDDRVKRLSDLNEIRNVFAHANGQLRWVKQGSRSQLQNIIARYPSLEVESDFLIPSQSYVLNAYEDVAGSIRALVHRATPPNLRKSSDGAA